jgi:predicted signal transduction protein with EAL and GGDEF domain
MSLVRGIHESPVKQKLFRSCATLCRDVDTEIVAEGVEVAEEHNPFGVISSSVIDAGALADGRERKVVVSP